MDSRRVDVKAPISPPVEWLLVFNLKQEGWKIDEMMLNVIPKWTWDVETLDWGKRENIKVTFLNTKTGSENDERVRGGMKSR